MSKDTSQKQRMPAALSPEYFKVDDRSIHDLFKEAQELAEALAFYHTSAEEASGNWSPFLEQGESFLDLSGVDHAGECPPHLGLFLAFLKLFGYTQHQLNALTASHLHFFYHKILAQEKKKAQPDKVFVFFELARNVRHFLLPEQAALPAGKDEKGNELLYKTDREIFLSQARISGFKAVYNSKKPDDAIYAFPVADSLDGAGVPLEEGQGWYPFGNPGASGSSPKIGFGTSSPVLFLKEGVRTIQLSFSLAAGKASRLNTLDPAEFEVLLTGPDDWFRKEVEAIRYRDGKLTFSVQLNEADPAVTGFDKDKHHYGLNSSGYPILMVVLKQGFTYSRYAFIQSLRINGITISVDVEKAHSLSIRNDFGELDPSRAFHPFGYNPVKGANLYLGFEETFLKPISRLSLHIRWKGLHESFKTYYEGYLGPTNSLVNRNEDFKVKASIRRRREWLEIKEFPLFSKKFELTIENQYKRETDGLVRLALSSPDNAFGHTLYPSVYAKAIMSQLQDKAAPIPNEPYTPVIESVELAYAAEEETAQFFHIKPFGIEQVPVKNNPLISGEFHHAGSLYLGIENLDPPQQLAIFFEIEQEIQQDKPDLEFYYLNNTRWDRLSENQILSDTTLGLKQTGILLLNLPAGMATGNPAMPAGYHWIRISVPGNPESFDRILSVRTNAVSCTSAHDHTRLPPLSIKGLSRKVAEIKKIEQPYPSSGGRPAEKESDYFTRVSEKLRHKIRGISSWDMERIILEQFPQIYQVKCIQHRDAKGQTAPGSIHIIVIPFLKQYHRSKVLKPMVAKSTLAEIQKYIEHLSSSHARIQVTNPSFEEIKVVAQVSFNIQVDAGFYVKQLQHDLQRFLSPWAFQDEMEIQLGSKLYRSSIIEFIESRHYVNFIASIRLLKNGQVIQDQEISPDDQTLIVSSDVHEIEAVEPDRVICQTNQGIEQMIVDINFEVQ